MKTLTKSQYFKRDNILVDLLSKHKGEQNAIHHSKIIEHLKLKGFDVTHSGLRALISRTKLDRKIPIVYKRGIGYFWANSKNEILNTINDLKSMQNSLQEQIDLLNMFIID